MVYNNTTLRFEPPVASSKPSDLKIGAHHYDIEYSDLIYDPEEQTEYLGRCHYPDLKMQVKIGRAPSQVAETFLHEAVHAISNDRQLGMDEHQVDQVASGLLAMIVDNPVVFGTTFMECFE